MSERIDGLAYEVAGDGAPLILVHAGIADRTMWDPVWERLAELFRVIRFDQRGFGESDDPAEPWYLHEDIATVLAAASGDPALIVGASLGGIAALDLALERPELVDRLVTVGSAPDGWRHHPSLVARFEEVDELFESGEIDAANERELEIWMDGTRAAGACEAGPRERISRINRALLERQASLPESLDLEPPAIDRLGSLEVPLLVEAGEHDQPSTRECAELLAERTGSRFVEIPGAAHVPSLEHPDAWLDATLPFLQGAPA